ncbi:MAG: methyltransferase domain-containing protein [Acidobacteriia bacterium]|nr:methyltransferase domain-containing protein [Terriglobia bacterium]
MSGTPLFDAYADSYDHALDHALAVTGLAKDYFCKERMTWLGQCLMALGEQPRRGLDYGCGNGSSTPLLASMLNVREVFGVDVAPKIVAKAREHYGANHLQFATVSETTSSGEFDLAYCNGVFHHIEKPARPAALDYVYGRLRPGGIFSLWENNPWSPAARYVMSRCAFDEDAQMLAADETKRLLQNAGFEILSTDFLFIFPAFLKSLRPLERRVYKLPIGAQYQVLARKGPGGRQQPS